LVDSGPILAIGDTACRLDEIGDPGAREFRLATSRGPRSIFVVRSGGRVFGYMNLCPHEAATLDIAPDEFLTEDGASIECAMHGARFRIEDGVCVEGPCLGEELALVPLRVDEGHVVIDPRWWWKP